MFVGQFNTGDVVRYTLNAARDGVTGADLFVSGISGGITDVAFAPDGTLYILTSDAIHRVVPE
jgi:glucose/arabinose dehydrogenase